ncbi:hypothetical protein [Methylomonas sp. DH-1]|uniref:hypothetical protein n=1 Tax=Methylomonas sp. (strain DH-1) TaxID=1727196 RepID=UPI0007C968D5|nr:hypothetical protein [Methylomonas sp. DH-1]ANE56058.1 hypothetical protein AYM39_13300 [Methylomonas sp. DH-1]
MNSNKPSGGGGLTVGFAQSSRLRKMREKALGAATPAPAVTPAIAETSAGDTKLSPELLLARRLIDRRLSELLATLPSGKQHSLFRIRFGIELNRIKDLPIRQVFSRLKIADPQLPPHSPAMKRIGDLNYNGKPCG